DEARVVRDLVHERQPPLRLLDRGGVDLPELGDRGPQTSEERALRFLGEARGAGAEQLVSVELLVDFEAAPQTEGLVVHRGSASWRLRIKASANVGPHDGLGWRCDHGVAR